MYREMIEKVYEDILDKSIPHYREDEAIIVTNYYPVKLLGSKESKDLRVLGDTIADELKYQLFKVANRTFIERSFEETIFTVDTLFDYETNRQSLIDDFIDFGENATSHVSEMVIDAFPRTAVNSLLYMEHSGESQSISNSIDYYIIVIKWKKEDIKGTAIAKGYNLNQYISDSLAGIM